MKIEINRDINSILSRNIENIPFIKREWGKYYYFKDNYTEIFGKETEEFTLITCKENEEEICLFNFNKGNLLSIFMDINTKAIEEMYKEIKKQIIEILQIKI